MEDTIYRQAAIDALEREKTYSTAFHDGYTPINVFEKYNAGLTDGIKALKNLPSAQQEQQWIPCNEGLPKEKDAGILKKLGTNKKSDYVIATIETKGERMTVTACTYDGKWAWNTKYAFPDFKVIAWMPFPEPYKMDKEWEEPEINPCRGCKDYNGRGGCLSNGGCGK